MPLRTELGNVLGRNFDAAGVSVKCGTGLRPVRGWEHRPEVCATITPRTASLPNAADGVIFSGQNFCRAQSQNCETKTPFDHATRGVGGLERLS